MHNGNPSRIHELIVISAMLWLQYICSTIGFSLRYDRRIVSWATTEFSDFGTARLHTIAGTPRLRSAETSKPVTQKVHNNSNQISVITKPLLNPLITCLSRFSTMEIESCRGYGKLRWSKSLSDHARFFVNIINEYIRQLSKPSHLV